jgi:hydrogenase maturation protease
VTVPLTLIGVGNAFRSDDAAGLEVARRLEPDLASAGGRTLLYEGDPAGLLDAWEGASKVTVIDASSSGAEPGTIQRYDAAAAALPTALRGSTSSHAFSVTEAIQLARSLDRLPSCLTVYAIEGSNFGAGEHLSPEVEAAVAQLVDELRDALHDSR